MDPEQKKTSLRNITYGVYVMTVKSGENYAAATVTWEKGQPCDPICTALLGLAEGSGLSGSPVYMEYSGILGTDDWFIASPAISQGNIFLRGKTLYCIGG